MILITCFLLMLSGAWEVFGASFSNVYFQTGPEAGAPVVDYLKYGTPSISYTAPQVAQYNVAPVGYEYPFGRSYSYKTAYPEQTIAAVAPPIPSANIIYEYNAPVSNLPVVVGGRNYPAGYEYSYTLVNQGGGHELKPLSGGEIVRGGYTFLQPEGLVQYVTDSNEGFNAIFKNYLPNEVKHTETVHHVTAHHAEPCHEAKSGALILHESHPDHDEKHVGHVQAEQGEHEARHGAHEKPDHSHIVHIDHQEPHEGGASQEDKIIIVLEEGHHDPEHEHEGHHNEDHKGHSEPKDKEEVEPEVSHTHQHPESGHTHEKIVEEHNHETPVAVIPEHPALGSNVYISYNDFIRCIQAATARGTTYPYYAPAPKPVSPLTYLVFNKPC